MKETARLECGDMRTLVPRMEETPDLIVMSPPDVSEMKDEFGAYSEFLTRIYTIAGERVRDGGVVVSTTTDRRHKGRVWTKHAVIMDAMRAAGLRLEDYKIWCKSLKTNLFIPTFAHILIGRKPGGARTKNKVREFLPDVWHLPLDRVKDYPNHDAFPSELVRRVVLRYTHGGDLVLDPFVGSGKTVLVCRELDRRSIGFDSDPEAIARLRRLLSA